MQLNPVLDNLLKSLLGGNERHIRRVHLTTLNYRREINHYPVHLENDEWIVLVTPVGDLIYAGKYANNMQA